MKTFFLGLFACSASAEMTLPRDESDLLIAAPCKICRGQNNDRASCDYHGDTHGQDVELAWATCNKITCSYEPGLINVNSYPLCTSFRRSPVAPVDSARSDPARSTRFMSDATSLTRPSSVIICLTDIVITVCARDDVAFI